MILAAGLSPAWQQIMQFDALRAGEVNRAQTAQWCASGKVMNVAIAAQRLGARTAVLSAIGGPAGAAIREDIETLGIFADWITIPQPTRVCTTLLEASGTTTELVENVGPVDAAVLEEFYEKFRIHAEVADVAVITGSMPANAPDNYYAALIRDVPQRFILDIRGEQLIHALPMSPFLVKPNREELQASVGEQLHSDDDVLAASRQLNRRGAEWAVVSDGPRALFVTSLTEAYRVTPPRVNVVNPIGSGDCLAAGIALKLMEGDDVIDAIRFGVAAAALNATTLLPAQLDAKACETLAETIEVIECHLST